MRKKVIFVIAVFLMVVTAYTIKTIYKSVPATYKTANTEIKLAGNQALTSKTMKVQIPFIENQGQVADEVRYYANTFAGNVYVTKQGEIIYSFSNNKTEKNDYIAAGFNPREKEKSEPLWIKESFAGSKKINVKGADRSATKINYFVGTKENWKTGIASWNEVFYGEIYDNIELKLHAYGKNVEKVFTVNPEGRVEDIEISIDNARKLTINDKGELIVESPSGNISFTKPYAYQLIDGRKTEVEAEYSINDETYGFKVASYNKNYPLIIDPLLASTFVGGMTKIHSNDYGEYVAQDSLGNIFVAGFTSSSDFPVTEGSYDTIVAIKDRNSGDPFISKFDSTLSTLLSSTYIDNYESAMFIDSSDNIIVVGTSTSSDSSVKSSNLSMQIFDNNLTTLKASSLIDIGMEIDSYAQFRLAVDSQKNIFIAGTTRSTKLTPVSGSYDNTHNGQEDVFIVKLDKDLTTLLGSTYLGGSGKDTGTSLAIDASDNVYLAGKTWSESFPVTEGAYNGVYDKTENNTKIYISMFDNNLQTLIASTFVGKGWGSEITIDSSGNIAITGNTDSNDFPVTTGAYDTSYNNDIDNVFDNDIFVSILSSDLSSLLYSTFLAGTGRNKSSTIIIDSTGKIIVAGMTNATDFPVTNGAYDTSYNSEYDYGFNLFITKFNSDLSSVVASTYLGGIRDENMYSVLLDSSDNIVVAGTTSSFDYPATSSSFDSTFNEDNSASNLETDIFISKLDSNLSTLLASTFLGGSLNNGSGDEGMSIVVDSDGSLIVAGITDSADLPVTQGAYDTTFKPIFILKIDSSLSTISSLTYMGGEASSQDLELKLDSSGNIFLSCRTYSEDYPTTQGAYKTEFTSGDEDTGERNLAVSKFDNSLSTLLASTYIGIANSANSAIDSSGNLFISGKTGWSDFPVTNGAYNTSFYGKDSDANAYVLKLDNNLTSLLASTFISAGSANSISVDSKDNIFVSGSTYYKKFPTTSNAYDKSFSKGGRNAGTRIDAFIAKLDNDLSSLLASTFLGGNRQDSSSVAVLDKNDNIVIAGITKSASFPLKKFSFDKVLNGNVKVNTRLVPDVFIATLDNKLKSLRASTLIGGIGTDYPGSLSIDFAGNIILAGVTDSSDFPVTQGSFSASRFDLTSRDIFVAKLNSKLSTLIASTFIGGEKWDDLNSMAIDSEGNIFLTGETGSSDFPTTEGAFDSTFNGGDDVFISKFDGNLGDVPQVSMRWVGGPNENCKNKNSYPKCILQGKIKIKNRTSSKVKRCSVKVYLSDDKTFDEDTDTFLKKIKSGNIKAGKQKQKKFNHSLIGGESAKGSYLIAVISSANGTPNADAEDNVLVYGPIDQ